jgi:hypothetical protein
MSVHARRGDKRAKTVDSQDAKGEKHALAQIGDSEDIKKLLKHVWLSASGVYRRSTLAIPL